MIREKKLKVLSRVLGIPNLGVDSDHDPDTTYKLTADNVMKILAIYMRFR